MILISLQIFKRYRKLLCIALLSTAIVLLSSSAYAQNAPEIETTLESAQISRTIDIGQPLTPITFHLFEKYGEHNLTLQFLTDGLTEQSNKWSIGKEFINITRQGGFNAADPFTLEQNTIAEITITINTKDAKPGLYKGVILVHAENATDIKIPIELTVNQPAFVAAIANLLGVLFGVLMVVLNIALPNTTNLATFRSNVLSRFNWREFWKNAKAVIAFFAVLLIVALTAIIGFYPKIVAFGANPLIDYGTAFLFGVSQVGASKISADLFKTK
jgi:hypothetical protein